MPNGLEITATITNEFNEILTEDALTFIRDLERMFGRRRVECLERRVKRQKELDAGKLPDFLPETKEIRVGDWKIAPLPEDLRNRRVEITGPVDRKMVINALNSGAFCYMADFEDSHSPTWEGTIEGQINLRDAVNRTIEFINPNGKHYKLNEKTAVLLVRPRGWHLVEKHVLVDGKPISAGIFDFGLYFFHNARNLRKNGSGPYFYLPKLESHLEARLWNDIFVEAQKKLDIPNGTIKATVLIETIMASFEMNEILYELKNHSSGLNCGRWDYIFSMIKRLKKNPDYIFPDRGQVTMTVPCMRNYSLLTIQTCHRRGAPAMGGMAAQIPIKNDEAANEEAISKVRADKKREAENGHDGTWVAHPGLVAITREEFDRVMKTPNQMDNLRNDVRVTARDLVEVPKGTITEEGLRHNIRVGIQYMAAWIGGLGCVPLYNLMEDAATAEICRTQVWQWIHHPKGILDDGRNVTLDLVREMIREEVGKLSVDNLETAQKMFEDIVSSDELEEFLTLKAYEKLA